MTCRSYVSDEDLTVFREKIIAKSRKEFQCPECLEIIPAGSSYIKITSSNRDEIQTDKACCGCHEIRRALFDSYVLGGLRKQINEECEDLSMENIDKLSVFARKKFLQLYKDDFDT